jgi:hypothetical protein
MNSTGQSEFIFFKSIGRVLGVKNNSQPDLLQENFSISRRPSSSAKVNLKSEPLHCLLPMYCLLPMHGLLPMPQFGQEQKSIHTRLL